MTDKSYATITRQSHFKILRLYNVYDILKDLPNDMQNVIMTFTSHQSSLQLLEYIKFNIRHLLYKHLSHGGAKPPRKPPISERGLEVGIPSSQKGGVLKGSIHPSRDELLFYEENYDCDISKNKNRKSKSKKEKKKIKYVSKKHETLSRHRSSFEKYVLNNNYHMYNDYDDTFYVKYYDYDCEYGYEYDDDDDYMYNDYSDDDFYYNRRKRYKYDDDMYYYYDDIYHDYYDYLISHHTQHFV